MVAKERHAETKKRPVDRSSDDIRQDIAKEEENISHAVEQIGERIHEKLDWRGYVKESPYWAIGAAAGLGYLASGIFRTRTTPMERIMGSVAVEVRDALGGMAAGASGPGLIKLTLLSIATKAAAKWMKKVTSAAPESGQKDQTVSGR